MDIVNPAYIKAASIAKQKAHAPYSKFHVGAALISEDGKIFSGCNIESSSYSLTICAERVAIFKAISEGITEFQSIYIATDTEESCPPCGACRQVLWDLAGDIFVVMVNKYGDAKTAMLHQLLPDAFDKDFFEEI
ncbi:cytidine deaminase [candidate division KSB1 bacterium]|nr:cytidine deaminase [candidate division KSB1 bacterium]